MKKQDYNIGEIISDIFIGQTCIEKNIFAVNHPLIGFRINLIVNDRINNMFNCHSNIKLNVQKKLIINTDSVQYNDENGFSHTFRLNEYGDYRAESDIKKGLVKNGDYYEIIYHSFLKEVYNLDGNIVRIVDRSDIILHTYQYDSSGKLIFFGNESGQGINIEYNDQNYIYKVKTQDNILLFTINYFSTYKIITIGDVNYYVYNASPLTAETKTSASELKEKIIITNNTSDSTVDIKKYIGNNLVIHKNIINTFGFTPNKYQIIVEDKISNKKMAYIYQNYKLQYHYELLDEMFHPLRGDYQYKGDVYIDSNDQLVHGKISEEGFDSVYQYCNKIASNENWIFSYHEDITEPTVLMITFWVYKNNAIPSNVPYYINDTLGGYIYLSYLHSGWNFVGMTLPLELDITNFIREIKLNFYSTEIRETYFKDVRISKGDNRLFFTKNYIAYNNYLYDMSSMKIKYQKNQEYQTFDMNINIFKNNLLNKIKYGDLQSYAFIDEESGLVSYDSVVYELPGITGINLFDCEAVSIYKVNNRELKTNILYYNNQMLVNNLYIGTDVPEGNYTISKQYYDCEGNIVHINKEDIDTFAYYDEFNRIVSQINRVTDDESQIYQIEKNYSYYNNNLLQEEITENQDVINYTYDNIGRVSTVNGLGVLSSYTYNNGNLITFNQNNHVYNYTYEDEMIKEIQEDNLKYTYDYENNKIKTIKQNSNIIVEYDYLNNDKEIIKKIYTSQSSFYGYKDVYDDYGKLLERYEITSVINSDGTLDIVVGNKILENQYTLPSLTPKLITTYYNTNVSILKNQSIGEYDYYYDYTLVSRKIKNVSQYKNDELLYDILYTYGPKIEDSLIANEEVLQKTNITINSKNLEEKYTYNSIHILDNLLQKVELKKGSSGEEISLYGSINYTYDILKRLKTKINTIGSKYISESYQYKKNIIGSINRETTLLKKVSYYDSTQTQKTIEIIYDSSYNISELKEGTVSKNKYTYDSYNRLIREDNKDYNATITYEYDENGNILFRKKYQYTLGTLGTPYNIDSYQYGSRLNQLISYNNESTNINYEGNCTKVNGYTLTYSKGKLVGGSSGNFTIGTTFIDYQYDKSGLRLKKIYNYTPGAQALVQYVTNKTNTYTYVLGRLMYEDIVTTYNNDTNTYEKIEYNYINNELVGFTLTKNNVTNEYIYRKNILGDIIEIYDSELNLVGEYVYDAYGNTIIKTNVNSIASINPFRYRGYYYDVETNLALVSSRYYSPELGRFIQPADVSSLNPQSINGLNLYTYANNNPIGILYSSSGVGFGDSGAMVSLLSLGGLSSFGNNLAYSNSLNIFAGLNWPKFNTKDLVKDTFISLGEVGSRIAWGLTKNGRAFLDFHYSAYGINGYTALDNLSSTSAKIFKGIGIGLMALDVIEAGYYSYQNGHSFVQGALNVGLTAGKNFLVYKASTGVATAVGIWAGAKLGASLGSAAGPVGFVIGAVAGAAVGWVIDEFGDVIIDWVVGWFD